MDRTQKTWIKFCGLTSLEDTREAVQAGADLIGFNFFKGSPRYIEPSACARLVRIMRSELGEVMDRIQLVGVFVNAAPGEIRLTLEQCDLDLAQLSGDETPDDLAHLGGLAYKTIHGVDAGTLEKIRMTLPQRDQPPMALIDAASPGLYGGTGRTVDWIQVRAIAQRIPILLAGGLNVSNVGQAIQTVQPWGVDVASGIETSPGKKDPAKMIDFVQAVRESSSWSLGQALPEDRKQHQ